MNVTLADGLGGEVDFDERKSRISPHTGRTLRRGAITVRVDRRHDGLMATLPRRVIESDEGRWLVVRRTQHSFNDRSRVAEHMFEVEEFENRAVTLLKIADLSLTPEKYYETSSRDEGLEIFARVVLRDEQNLERLREILANEEEVAVIREGVHDAPRQMDVSVLGWSEREGEHVFELKCKDPSTRKPTALLGWHWAMADAGALAYLIEWRTRMTTLLIEKELVSKEELDQVDDLAFKNAGKRRIAFVKVADVRTHPFPGDTDD